MWLCEVIWKRFKELRRQFSSSALQKSYFEELTQNKQQIGDLTFSADSPEMQKECQRHYELTQKINPHLSPSCIWDFVNSQRSALAQQLSKDKRADWRQELIKTYSSKLPSLSSMARERLMDSFLDGNLHPLAEALMNHIKADVQKKIGQQYPNCSIRDIALAIDDGGDAAAIRIGTQEARDQLRQQKELNDKVESSFVRIGLGQHEEPIDLEGKCFWVPASVRHEVRKDPETGQSRYSFFVYGGVNIQPRINVVQGGNAPLSCWGLQTDSALLTLKCE